MNKKWSEKESTNLFPRWNFLLRELKEGNTSLRWLLTSTMELLITTCCLDIKWSNEKQCYVEKGVNLFSSSSFISWLLESIAIYNWFLPLNLQRWWIIEISPAIAWIPMEGDVWKASKIHIVALCHILLSLLSRYESGALL